MPNIHDIWLKIKLLLEGSIHEWGLVIIVFLVALASFGLGRLSALESSRPPVSITQTGAAGAARTLPLGGQYVAARGGSVYYYPWCSGATKILLQNQVWFSSEKDAQKAGYRAAKNCKGL
jgi:hypothetical protein